MRRSVLLKSLFCIALPMMASASGEVNYWPGFQGHVSKFDIPMDPADAKDRYLSLSVRLKAEPAAHEKTFDSAFHAVCRRHQGDLLRVAKKASSHSDWRVKVSFEWPISASNGVSISQKRFKYMWVANCLFQ